jgi:predicted GNAT family acetyltransferase
MKVELVGSVQEFLATTATFRAADPLRTNVIGSVALSIADGDRTYDDYRWWVVRDDTRRIVGIAMRTAPFNMVVTSMSSDAARELGRSVAQFDDSLPGITGSKDVIEALVEGYVGSNSAGSRRRLTEARRDLLYELEELVTPDVEGFARPAHHDDLELLAPMMSEFLRETEQMRISVSESHDSTRRKINEGSLYCWVVSGDVVAIAGHANVVATGSIVIGRVGPVYTPPQHRRHGYASAVTAHVTRSLIEGGARVMLFTDAANPTSNSIYQAIGYRLVDELIEVRFEDV